MTPTNQTTGHPDNNHDVRDRLVEVKDDVAKRIDALGTLMKAHPFAALGVALGIGYLVARVVHR